jgi:hypothetical protein
VEATARFVLPIAVSSTRRRNPAIHEIGAGPISEHSPIPIRITFALIGYRETYDFLLKEPLSRKLFDKLWNYVYGKDLNVSAEGGRP